MTSPRIEKTGADGATMVERRALTRKGPFATGFNRLLGLSDRRYWAYILLVPSTVLLFGVIVYPIGSGIALSFREMQLTRPLLGTGFVGLQHYIDLFQDPIFFTALRNTVVWTAVGVSSQFLLGFASAIALNHRARGSSIAAVLIMLPWFLPSVVAGQMWELMLDSHVGVINDILVRIGVLHQYKAWFVQPNTALLTVLVVSLWQSFPFFTLFLYAGMQAIPDDLYEAATVDGAGPLQKLWRVTVPLLMPMIVATVALRVIGLVNSPDLLIILTNGGPGNATQILSLYAFQTAFNSFDFGYAAAISVVILIILMCFAIVYMRSSGALKES